MIRSRSFFSILILSYRSFFPPLKAFWIFTIPDTRQPMQNNTVTGFGTEISIIPATRNHIPHIIVHIPLIRTSIFTAVFISYLRFDVSSFTVTFHTFHISIHKRRNGQQIKHHQNDNYSIRKFNIHDIGNGEHSYRDIENTLSS